MSAYEEQLERFRQDPRSTEELIALVLTKDAEADDNGYWHPIWILQQRLPGTFDRVTELANSPEEKAREIAATLLGQNGRPEKDRVMVEECLNLLLLMLRRETSLFVLESIIYAIGHFHAPRAVEPLVAFVNHPETDVRYAVVHSLCGDDDERAICALTGLTTDPDIRVRDWATFALGSQTELNTPEIRDTLLARVNDPDDDTRCEAYIGLAQRGDLRLAAPFLHELDSTGIDLLQDWRLIAETAGLIADHATQTGGRQWLPVLEKLKALELGDSARVQAALDHYQPPHPSAVSPGRASESNTNADVNIGQQPE